MIIIGIILGSTIYGMYRNEIGPIVTPYTNRYAKSETSTITPVRIGIYLTSGPTVVIVYPRIKVHIPHDKQPY